MSEGRLFQIVYLLLERGPMTAPELAKRLEVSVRTVYRDADALSAAGVPIRAVSGQGGGFSILPGFSLSRALLSHGEQAQLLTALKSQPDGTDALLSKLSALFGREEPDWLQVDLSHWGTPDGEKARFNDLRDAILQHKLVAFTYVSSYAQTTERRVLPARLCYKGRGWYLQGFCLTKNAYRTFKISRMVELTVTGERFTQALAPPPIDDPAPPPGQVELTLRFLPVLAYRVYDEFDRSQIVREADGSLVVRTALPEDAWLHGYLLSFGTGLEVIAPARIRLLRGRLAQGIAENAFRPDTRCQECSATMNSSQTKEGVHMEHKFCQSCGMPLEDAALLGTETDGSASADYCQYCYEGGKFKGETTMEQMIDFCAPMMVQGNPGMTEDQAKAQMRQFFPLLKRWKA